MATRIDFDSSDLRRMLAQGHETTSVEFKGAGGSAGMLLAKVARAVLGLANRRDGGFVVIGVDEEADGSLSPQGLSAEHLETWSFDDVSSQINAYADPPVEFDLLRVELDGKVFVVLRVAEFSSVPVLCKKDWNSKDGKTVLRQGACYVRSSAKPETRAIPTQTEMRELLEVATEKRLRAYFALSASAGLAVSDLARTAAGKRFDAEPELSVGPILNELRSRGHWAIRIHPDTYDPVRVDLAALESIVERCSVRLGGWRFPYISGKSRPVIHHDAVELLEFSWADQREAWRFSKSGLFHDALAFSEDWEYELKILPSALPAKAKPAPSRRIGVLYVVKTLFEVFEFASRLATAIPGADDFRIEVAAVGLAGRELIVDDPRRFPFAPGEFVASSDRWPLSRAVNRGVLAGDTRVLAAEAAKELFAMFRWAPATEQLEDIARGLVPRR